MVPPLELTVMSLVAVALLLVETKPPRLIAPGAAKLTPPPPPVKRPPLLPVETLPPVLVMRMSLDAVGVPPLAETWLFTWMFPPAVNVTPPPLLALTRAAVSAPTAVTLTALPANRPAVAVKGAGGDGNVAAAHATCHECPVHRHAAVRRGPQRDVPVVVPLNRSLATVMVLVPPGSVALVSMTTVPLSNRWADSMPVIPMPVLPLTTMAAIAPSRCRSRRRASGCWWRWRGWRW